MKRIITRILIDIALLLGLFLLPWWLWLVLAVVAIFFITPYYELVFLGFLGDAAYGAGAGGSQTHFFFLGVTFALVFFSIILKPRLIFYTNR